MLWLGVVLLIIGAVIAAFLHRTLGIVCAVIGLVLILLALVVVADTNTAALLL